jgi:hypothetical protein
MKRPDEICCCLCWLDGIRSEPIKGWDGVPICREHLAEVIGKNSPSLPMQARGFAAPSTTLH